MIEHLASPATNPRHGSVSAHWLRWVLVAAYGTELFLAAVGGVDNAAWEAWLRRHADAVGIAVTGRPDADTRTPAAAPHPRLFLRGQRDWAMRDAAARALNNGRSQRLLAALWARVQQQHGGQVPLMEFVTEYRAQLLGAAAAGNWLAATDLVDDGATYIGDRRELGPWPHVGDVCRLLRSGECVRTRKMRVECRAERDPVTGAVWWRHVVVPVRETSNATPPDHNAPSPKAPSRAPRCVLDDILTDILFALPSTNDK